ncbi:MAG: hypothetical protein J6Y99_03085, partial [Bacteroidales bacterium]|nr:hypothetical protein [Bacteroidales bacterium]
MKNIWNILLCALTLSLGTALFPTQARADVVVRGRVYAFDGSQRQRPLAGVEIQAVGAGSTVSGADGRFTLRFRVLQEGDRIRFRSLFKPGYSLLNKSAVEAMVIPADSSSVLTIVMSNDRQMEQTRRTYFLAAAKNYQREAARQEKTYKAQVKSGQMTQSEYLQKIQEVKSRLETRLERADLYIERFVRVDVSQLQGVEQRIFKLIRNGRYDEAIQLYESQNLVDKICQQGQNIVQQKSAQFELQMALSTHNEERDSLFTILQRQADLLCLAGGKENHDRALSILRTSAYADTTYAPGMSSLGLLCYRQLRYDEAGQAYDIMCRHTSPHSDTLFQALVMKGASLQMQRQIDEAEEALTRALSENDSAHCSLHYRAMAYYYLGQIHRQRQHHDVYPEYFRRSYELFNEELMQDTTNLERRVDVVRAQIYCGYVYSRAGQFEEALRCHREALRHVKYAYQSKPRSYLALMGFVYQYIANDYVRYGGEKLQDALYNYSVADTLYRRSIDYNPEGYLPYLANLYARIGGTYKLMGDTDRAVEYYLKSNQVYGHYLAIVPDNQSALYAIKENNDLIRQVQQSVQSSAQPPLTTPAKESTELHSEED